MSEDLRARAIESVARAWWATTATPCEYDELKPGGLAALHEMTTPFADAVLAVVADYCDGQTAPAVLDLRVPVHDDVKDLSMGRQIGWVDAYRRVAGACRVQEDKK